MRFPFNKSWRSEVEDHGTVFVSTWDPNKLLAIVGDDLDTFNEAVDEISEIVNLALSKEQPLFATIGLGSFLSVWRGGGESSDAKTSDLLGAIFRIVERINRTAYGEECHSRTIGLSFGIAAGRVKLFDEILTGDARRIAHRCCESAIESECLLGVEEEIIMSHPESLQLGNRVDIIESCWHQQGVVCVPYDIFMDSRGVL